METPKSCSKWKEVCRTCLGEERLRPLFGNSSQYKQRDFYLTVTAVSQIKIAKNDGLPQKICDLCKVKAAIAYEFITKLQEVDAELRSISSNGEKAKINAYDIKKEEHLEEVETDLTPYDDDAADTDSLQSDITYKKCTEISLEADLTESEGAKPERTSNITDENVVNDPKLTIKKRGRPKKSDTKTTVRDVNVKVQKQKRNHGMRCPFCSDFSASPAEILKHYTTHHKESSVYCCFLCKQLYFDELMLRGHTCPKNQSDAEETQNEDDDHITCALILLHSVYPPADFESYLKSKNRDEGPTVCGDCGSCFFTKNQFLIHVDAAHPEKSHRCHICSKVFLSVKTAQRHIRYCDEADKVFECTTCGEKFALELSLNKHILGQHSGEDASVLFLDHSRKDPSKLSCDVCNRSYQSKELLERHMKAHSGKKTTLYECDVCHRTFPRKDNYKAHMRVHNEDRTMAPLSVKPAAAPHSGKWLCPHCGQSFSSSSNMIVHMRRHTGQKPYKCDFCGKGFPRSYDLAVHRRSHTGEKPCICPMCGKCFSRSNKLTRHMHVHTGQKPYKCTYCEKAFAQSNDLRLHTRRHTGDKPYVCENCGERFIQGSALQNHRRAHGHFPPATSMLPPSGYSPLPPPRPQLGAHSSDRL